MCGPTATEKNQQQLNANFSNQVQSNYGTLFNEQQADAANLNQFDLAEINQPEGIGATAFNLENTQALDTTGANYANAARALNGQQAGRGGDSGLESGPQRQQQAALASAAAGQLSAEQLGIQQQNTATQLAQKQQGATGLLALSGQYNPNATANTGVQAGGQAFGEADTIAQQQAQEEQAIAGLVTTGATDALTFGAGGLDNLDTTGGSSGGEQIGNFFSGGLKALAG